MSQKVKTIFWVCALIVCVIGARTAKTEPSTYNQNANVINNDTVILENVENSNILDEDPEKPLEYQNTLGIDGHTSMVAVDKESFDQYIEYVLMEDAESIKKMINAEKVFVVDYNTKVNIIEENTHTETEATKISLVDGPLAGKTVWTLDYYINDKA